jgi:chromosomal replication initiator protein
MSPECAPRDDHGGAAAQLRHALAQKIGPHRYHMWFGQTDVDVSETQVRVHAATPFVAQWIDAHFSTELRAAAHDTLGPAAEVSIGVGADRDQAAMPESADAPQGNGAVDTAPPASQRVSRLRPRPDEPAPAADDQARAAPRRGQRLHAMEEFVVGATNRMAYAAANRLAADATPRGLSPLFIHGECGVGKTHLLQAICHRYIQRTGRANRVRYVTGEQFTNDFITALRSNAIDEFRQRVRRLELLAIDDVHFLANKVKTQSEFQCTLDAIDFGGARVAIASDNHPHHIRRFSQSLISRFLSGMVVKIERPDADLRAALIRRMAVRAAAVDEFAAQGGTSVRELEGLMTRLAAYRALAGDAAGADEIGLVLVEQVLREDRARPSHIVRISAVIDAVGQRLRVTKADLLGESRHRRIVVGRAMVAYLARELTTLSFPEIARALGRDNHSTVHTADQRLRRQLSDNEPLGLGEHNPAATIRELADLLRRDVCRSPGNGA